MDITAILERWRGWPWWARVITSIGLLALLILAGLWWLLRQGVIGGEMYRGAVDAHRTVVDARVDELRAQDEMLAEKQRKLREERKQAERSAMASAEAEREHNAAIDDAVARGDIDELHRLRDQWRDRYGG